MFKLTVTCSPTQGDLYVICIQFIWHSCESALLLCSPQLLICWSSSGGALVMPTGLTLRHAAVQNEQAWRQSHPSSSPAEHGAWDGLPEQGFRGPGGGFGRGHSSLHMSRGIHLLLMLCWLVIAVIVVIFQLISGRRAL